MEGTAGRDRCLYMRTTIAVGYFKMYYIYFSIAYNIYINATRGKNKLMFSTPSSLGRRTLGGLRVPERGLLGCIYRAVRNCS